MDALVRNWTTVVIVGTEERGERGKEDRHQAALFYADDGMVASSDPAGSRVHSTPWSACLIGWACGKTSGIKLTLSAAPARPQGISWKRYTGDG